MPKGDRLKLKADPEDGTTPIANLLLEAVAMAKLSGLQVRAILYLWRSTYGWVGKNGKRIKESKIGLTDWARALDSSNARVSHTLQELQDRGIIKRRLADVWGGYYYTLNTDISKWNSDCINLPKLCERVGIPSFATVDQNATVDLSVNSSGQDDSSQHDNSIPKTSATVDQTATEQLTKTQPPTLYKEILNKDIKKEGDIFKIFEDNFQKITRITTERLNDFIDTYGAEKVKTALEQAIKYNKRSLAYVEAILKGEGEDGTHKRGIEKGKEYTIDELKSGSGVGEYGDRVV